MKRMYQWTVNNYMLGAMVPCTPTDKIIEQKRIDKGHTEITYLLTSEAEREFVEQVLARRGTFKGFRR